MTLKNTTYELDVLARAESYRLVRGTFQARETLTFDRLDAAIEYGVTHKGPRPWMLYAVASDGACAHIQNVR